MRLFRQIHSLELSTHSDLKLNQFISIILLTASGWISIPLAAQSTSASEKPEAVIDRIESAHSGQLTIEIPDNILQYLLTDPGSTKKTTGTPALRPGVNRIAGYRIQVFSDGRNQSSLEGRAKARGSAIVAKFPKYRGQVYTHSSAPNWYTRVGNFRTQAEATSALAELKRAFPAFASEMRVVKSNVIIIR